jgi:hypothetical protein
MSFHKELLMEMIQEWSVEQLNLYLVDLRERREQMDTVIKEVQGIRRKLMKSRSTPENGPRDGR